MVAPTLDSAEFVDKCSDLVEEYFPKGKTKMRGEAIVLVAMITQFLLEKGLLSSKPKRTPKVKKGKAK